MKRNVCLLAFLSVTIIWGCDKKDLVNPTISNSMGEELLSQDYWNSKPPGYTIAGEELNQLQLISLSNQERVREIIHTLPPVFFAPVPAAKTDNFAYSYKFMLQRYRNKFTALQQSLGSLSDDDKLLAVLRFAHETGAMTVDSGNDLFNFYNYMEPMENFSPSEWEQGLYGFGFTLQCGGFSEYYEALLRYFGLDRGKRSTISYNDFSQPSSPSHTQVLALTLKGKDTIPLVLDAMYGMAFVDSFGKLIDIRTAADEIDCYGDGNRNLFVENLGQYWTSRYIQPIPTVLLAAEYDPNRVDSIVNEGVDLTGNKLWTVYAKRDALVFCTGRWAKAYNKLIYNKTGQIVDITQNYNDLKWLIKSEPEIGSSPNWNWGIALQTELRDPVCHRSPKTKSLPPVFTPTTKQKVGAFKSFQWP